MKRDAIARLLPEVFRRTLRDGTPSHALLAVMEDLQDPIERSLDRLDAEFDPRRARDEMVSFLAGWVDLERVLEAPAQHATGVPAVRTLPSGHGRLRELIAVAADLARLRGTAAGLRLFLETATGCPGFAVAEEEDSPGRARRPFHFQVRAPAQARQFETLIRGIVPHEKPAHTTYELEFEPAAGGERP